MRVRLSTRRSAAETSSAYVENDSDLMSASKARRLMRRTGIWASKYECAIVVIGHMNKSGGQKDLQAI